MPHGHSRAITVDGERYRWVVAPSDDGLRIVVVGGDGDEQRTATWVEHDVVIAPGLVAAVIRQALLRHGWTPWQRGKQVTLRCLDKAPDPADLRLIAWPPATW
ncbi:hypothetical protein [Streptomyces wuyuanensis]|uniref:hypothetical protein n=1 Tax=Streptomyces wuyuanensis TaxID=1196353 RepID=UPI0036A222D5